MQNKMIHACTDPFATLSYSDDSLLIDHAADDALLLEFADNRCTVTNLKTGWTKLVTETLAVAALYQTLETAKEVKSAYRPFEAIRALIKFTRKQLRHLLCKHPEIQTRRPGKERLIHIGDLFPHLDYIAQREITAAEVERWMEGIEQSKQRERRQIG
jgi:hypothetical protein